LNNRDDETLSAQKIDGRREYLNLLKRVLTRFELEDYTSLDPIELSFSRPLIRKVLNTTNRLIRPLGIGLGGVKSSDSSQREFGLDWPANAETMIGLARLNQLHEALQVIHAEGIQGDLMETGVWRGGSVIFMAAYVKVNDITKNIYVADSFMGLPRPKEQYKADVGDEHYKQTWLSVDIDTVKSNFKKYEVLDKNVIFVPGYFEDTMPNINVSKLSLLRLDGDMYQSTMDVLENLYFKVAKGGFVIIDDYGLKGARQAVTDFLDRNNLAPSIQTIDSIGVFWRVD